MVKWGISLPSPKISKVDADFFRYSLFIIFHDLNLSNFELKLRILTEKIQEKFDDSWAFC
jgi:hypothetical protein